MASLPGMLVGVDVVVPWDSSLEDCLEEAWWVTRPGAHGRVVAVAVLFEGSIWSLPAPNRHHHIIRVMSEQGVVSLENPMRGETQGFLTEDGTFLCRRAARVVAEHFKQTLSRDTRLPDLYSEDVW